MKNLLLAVFLLSVFFLTSCDKDDVCEQCRTVTTSSAQGIPDQVVTTTFTACGSDIAAAEGAVTSTATSGGITATATAVTTCQ